MNHSSLKTFSLLLFILCCFGNCRKSSRPKTELAKLPPITQKGLNSFGCLLNGAAYKPGSKGPLDRVLTVLYDPTFQGGSLIIRTKKIINGSRSIHLTLNADTINFVGSYPLSLRSKFAVSYSDESNCSFQTYYDLPLSGVLNISRFDVPGRIISGTFSFKISTGGCGTIEATEGRFDVRY